LGIVAAPVAGLLVVGVVCCAVVAAVAVAVVVVSWGPPLAVLRKPVIEPGSLAVASGFFALLSLCSFVRFAVRGPHS
jgi:hypothetical protein